MYARPNVEEKQQEPGVLLSRSPWTFGDFGRVTPRTAGRPLAKASLDVSLADHEWGRRSKKAAAG